MEVGAAAHPFRAIAQKPGNWRRDLGAGDCGLILDEDASAVAPVDRHVVGDQRVYQRHGALDRPDSSTAFESSLVVLDEAVGEAVDDSSAHPKSIAFGLTKTARKKAAKAAAEELRASNTRELAEMKKAATVEIEAAKKAAIGDLHSEASSLAVAIASRVLGREISSSDQQSLIDESLTEFTKVTK